MPSRFVMIALLAVIAAAPVHGQTVADAFDIHAAERFADLALACVHREYPNKIAHVLGSDKDVQPPRKLTPSFYGCFDWHSAVHGHWLLARLARMYPDTPLASKARAALALSLTPANIAREVAYLNGEGRASFERPYGLAWLLQLGAELREWKDPQAQTWSRSLSPLEGAVATRLKTWLPKLSHPVRSGEHSQSAFALGLVFDWAQAAGDHELEELVATRIRVFYLNDVQCPLAYEPSGEDFLSPCLAEADVVRRVLPAVEYAAWLGAFFPVLPRDGGEGWLSVAVVTDRTDGKLAHLDGLNLSRAWMLDGIASSLPSGDPRIKSLRATMKAHAASGLASVTGEHYEGGHWLGSFASYLVTRRGIDDVAKGGAPTE